MIDVRVWRTRRPVWARCRRAGVHRPARRSLARPPCRRRAGPRAPHGRPIVQALLPVRRESGW